MNIFSKTYSRIFQFGIKVLSSLIHFPIPKCYDRLEDIPNLLKDNNCKKSILVVSNSVSKSLRFLSFLDYLKDSGIDYSIYTGVAPDPTFKSIEVLAGFYRAHECDSIIAVGGGSVMDASKAMGALIAYPKKKLSHFKGVLKVHKDIPYFIAVPTTAGTGSEATIASVVMNEETNDKFSITDGHLVPKAAIMDDSLLIGLPKHIIAHSGMDAFTHAIEAFIGKTQTEISMDNAQRALHLISKNLYRFYVNPRLNDARKNMLYASFYAGVAFTRAYVGYVHALAHAIGGLYHKPHGYTVAILLPYVLKAYGKNAYKRLALASDSMGICDKDLTEEQKANQLISWILKMNMDMEIPKGFNGLIKESDLDFLVNHAHKEANPWYPVPKELGKKELREIIVKANNNEI